MTGVLRASRSPIVSASRPSRGSDVPARAWPFARATSLPVDWDHVRTGGALFWAEDGKYRWADENLVTYSEQFDNPIWVKGNSSITADAIAAPDGMVTADKLVEDGATSRHEVYYSLTLQDGYRVTASVYAKSAERSALNIFFSTGLVVDDDYAVFDLSSGVVHHESDPGSASIEAADNGFYRCSVTVEATGSAVRAYFATRDSLGTSRLPSYAGDGSSGLYLSKAHVHRADPDETAPRTYVKTEGSAYHAPRRQWHYDTDSGTWDRAYWLKEPQRENSLLHSRDFSDAVWVKAGSATVATGTGADGATKTIAVTDADGGNFGSIAQDITIADDSATHTASVLVPYDASPTHYPILQFTLSGGTTVTSQYALNTSTGVLTLTSGFGATSTKVTRLGDLWWVELRQANNSTGNTTARLRLYPASSSDGTTTDASATGTTIFDFAQIELNASFATNPMETAGSTVTRPPDVYTLDLSKLPGNQSRGGIVFDFDLLGFGGVLSDRILALDDGSANNRIEHYIPGGNDFSCLSRTDGGTTTAVSASTAGTVGRHRSAIGWSDTQGGDFSVDGDAVASWSAPAEGFADDMTTLRIGANSSGDQEVAIGINSITYLADHPGNGALAA